MYTMRHPALGQPRNPWHTYSHATPRLSHQSCTRVPASTRCHRAIQIRVHASKTPNNGHNPSQTSLSRRHTLLLGLLPWSLAAAPQQAQAESTGSAATALGGAVNQALSGLQSSAQGSFNALPSAPISVPDIDLSPRLLQSSVATNLTDAMTFTPTPAMMGVGVAAVVAASVIASKSKDVSNLERTVADLESQRTDLGQKITTLENSLNSTQKELTDALTAEQARVAQLQRTLEQETQAAATAADTAAKEQAALRTKIDELTTRGIEMTETLEAVAMERDAALVRSDQTTDKLAQVSKQLNTAEQTVYKLEEELAKSVKSGKEQAAALAELEGKLGTLKQQLKAQEAANNSLRVQAATLEAELEQVGEKLRAEEAHGAESSTQLAHYTRLAGHLEERIAEEMERSGKLQEDLVEATQKLEEQLTQLEEQEQKMAVLEKARAAAVEDTKVALAQERERRYQLEDEKAKVAQLTVDLKDAGDRYSQLQGRLADTETLLTTTQMHAEGMQGQIQQLQDEVAWAKQAYLEERETREDAERRAEDAKTQTDALLTEQQSMQDELAALQERSGSLESSLALVESQQEALDDANRQVALLSDELAQLTQVAKGDIRKLNLELIQTRGEAELLRQELEESARKLAQAETSLRRTKGSASDSNSNEELQQTRAVLEATQQELSSMSKAYQETAEVAMAATERLQELTQVEAELQVMQGLYEDAVKQLEVATQQQNTATQGQTTTEGLQQGQDGEGETVANLNLALNSKVGELEVSKAKVAALEEQLGQTQELLARVREEAAWANNITPSDLGTYSGAEQVDALVSDVKERAEMAAIEARAQAAMMVEAIEDRAVKAIEEAQLEAQKYQAEVEELRSKLAQQGDVV